MQAIQNLLAQSSAFVSSCSAALETLSTDFPSKIVSKFWCKKKEKMEKIFASLSKFMMYREQSYIVGSCRFLQEVRFSPQ